MNYVGIDWAYGRAAFCAIGESGVISAEGLIPANEDGLARLVLEQGSEVRAAVEMMSGDALAWGLVPLFLAAHGASIGEIGLVAGIYPAVWGLGQIWTGHWSDSVGRKPVIVAGMLVQAGALGLLALSGGAVAEAAVAAGALGIGTALVYPTLIAAVSDAVSPIARAPSVGVYRFWRDMGYVAGGLIAGLLADAIDFEAAIAVVAGLTAASGLWVALDLPSDRKHAEPLVSVDLPR
ncbi:MAG TPA: MFS transporter [Solirubrobacterales bacterium]|nr:MFS transporter [Solirubrobacterales bacterium]